MLSHYVLKRSSLLCDSNINSICDLFSFAATGSIAVAIAWFILPEVTRRTPAEIDEMYVPTTIYCCNSFFSCCGRLMRTWFYRFEKKVNLRKFKGHITEVQMRAGEHFLQEKGAASTG